MPKSKLTSLEISTLRPFLVPVAIILLIIVSGLLLVKPRISEILEIQRNLNQEKKKLAQLTAKAAALKGFDEEGLLDRSTKTAKALPSEKNLPLVISVLNGLTAKNNLELLSLEAEPGKLATTSAEGLSEETSTKKSTKESTQKPKEGDLNFLSFNVTLGGQMVDFKEFLGQLAKVVPLIGAENVVIETEGMGSSFEAEIALNSPFLLPPATLGVFEEPLPQITGDEETAYQKIIRLDFSLVERELPSVPTGKENIFGF